MRCFSLQKKLPDISVVLAILLMSLQALSLADDRGRQLDELMARYHELGQFNGSVLVVDGDAVLLRKGYGYADMDRQAENNPETKFLVGSITKGVTAAVVANLVDQNEVEPDGLVSDYLGWYRADTADRMTIRQLLTHTDGLPNYTQVRDYWEPYEDKTGFETRAYIERYASGDLEFDPGTEYRYGNSGYSVLGAIVESVTNKMYSDVVESRVLSPLGMLSSGSLRTGERVPDLASGYQVSYDGYRPAEPIWKPFFAAADLYSTVDDVAQFLRVFDATSQLAPAARAILVDDRGGLLEGRFVYGLSVATTTLGGAIEEQRLITTNGEVNGFNAAAVRLPEADKTVVLLNNTGEVDLFDIATNILRVIHHQAVDNPMPKVRDVFFQTLQTESLNNAIDYYRENRERAPDDYIYRRWPLRILAGQYKTDGRVDDAIRVLELNLETHPDDAQSKAELAMLQARD